MDCKLMAKSVELSAVAGMRSMSGPAFVLSDERLSENAAATKVFGSNRAKSAMQLMALGELIFDKLPFAPKRTSLFPLIGRAVSGAFVGASLFSAEKKSWCTGALIGAGSAVVAAKLSYETRRFLTKQAKIPDFVVAVLEDLLVLSSVSKYSLQDD